MSHRASGSDDSPEPCYGNATRRVPKAQENRQKALIPRQSSLCFDMICIRTSLSPWSLAMPWSSGKTLCIAGWPTRKTATTNASSVSDQNAGSRLKMRYFQCSQLGGKRSGWTRPAAEQWNRLRMRRWCDAWEHVLKNRATWLEMARHLQLHFKTLSLWALQSGHIVL
jgi:hypothetical protein